MSEEANALVVRKAVFEVLENNGTVPPHLPPRVRQAVLELAMARDDRTPMRKQKFDQALRQVTPMLALSSRYVPGSPLAERLISQWRMACSFGPAKLPDPKQHEKFEYTYIAKGGETIADVARTFGYDDPAPLCHPAYGYSQYMQLKTGDSIYVPFHPRLLNNLINASVKLCKKAYEQLKEDIERVHAANEKIEDFLFTIEAISILLSVGTAAIPGAALGAKAAAIKLPGYGAHITEETLEMLYIETGKTGVEILGIAIESSHKPKQGLFLYLRHSPIGWLSPAYWASLYTALKTKEPEVFLYGPEGIAYKRIEELKKQTQQHVQNLQLRIELMRNQLESPIYKSKC